MSAALQLDGQTVLAKLREEIMPVNPKDSDVVGDPVPHIVILNKILERIEPLCFSELAGVEDESKLNTKHYLVLSVQNIIDLAEENNWGLCLNNDFVYLYNGAYWKLIDKNQIKYFLGKAAYKMGVRKFDALHFKFRDDLYKQFLSEANLPIPERPNDKICVNLLNGTFEISDLGTRLREFHREDFITYQLPFEYNKDAQATLFKKYLDHVLPDKECQYVLAEFLAYIFIHPSILKLEKALLLYGSGANGKSVLFEIANALLGKENVSSFSLKSLTDDNGYTRASIANKLLNYATEISGKLESSFFKQLVSNEPIEARLPYCNPIIISNYARLIFNCNELPTDIEQTDAYFRRLIIIPFSVTIPESQQDKELPKKIINSELSGVFNWVLEGLNRLLTNKRFTESTIISDQVNIYRKQSNNVSLFLEDRGYKVSTSYSKPLKELFDDYKLFCVEDGYKSLGKKKFNERLKALKIPVSEINKGNIVHVEKSSFP